MQVFPHALPLRHVRQHGPDGAGPDVGVPGAGGCADRSVISIVDRVVVVRRSTVTSDSPTSTITGASSAGSASADSSSGSAIIGSGTRAASPRQPTVIHAAATTPVRRRIAGPPAPRTRPRTKSIPSLMMRLSVIALLSCLAACSRVNSGPPSEYPVVPGVELGTGISSLSGMSAGKCVEPRPVDTVQHRVDRLSEQIVYLHDKTELLRTLGISGGVSFGLFGIGVNASAESINRNFQSTSTSFIVIDIRIKTASKQLRKYQLERGARETLRRDGPAKFYEMCGDGFVAEIQQGGSFLGLVALENVSREEANRLSGSAGVSFLGFGVQGGASREAREFFERHRARYFVIQEGGTAGAVRSLAPESSIEALLLRADRFKNSIAGKAVPTRLIVKPYQTTSNRPRRDHLWDLTAERRFLAGLVDHHEDLHRADAQLTTHLATHTCAREKDRGRIERQHDEYTAAIAALRQRAEDCIRDPRKHCREKGLDFVNADYQRKLLALCSSDTAEPTRRSGVLGVMTRPTPPAPPAPPPPRPGIDAPCQTWRFDSLNVEVAPSKSGGAPWDGDGSPPDTAVNLYLGERKVSFPKRSSYSNGGVINDGLVSTGLSMRAVIIDRDAFFDDRIADLTGNVPDRLPDGAWNLQSGRTSLTLRGRCIE